MGYRFTVPLKKVMQVDLTATCDVFVKLDERRKQLRFEAAGARLVTGDDIPEDGAEVRMPCILLSCSNARRKKEAVDVPGGGDEAHLLAMALLSRGLKQHYLEFSSVCLSIILTCVVILPIMCTKALRGIDAAVA